MLKTKLSFFTSKFLVGDEVCLCLESPLCSHVQLLLNSDILCQVGSKLQAIFLPNG